MRDAAGELSDSLHLVSLAQAFLGLLALAHAKREIVEEDVEGNTEPRRPVREVRLVGNHDARRGVAERRGGHHREHVLEGRDALHLTTLANPASFMDPG